MFCLFSVISLLVIPGISNQEWGVQYSRKMICALKGSTIRLSDSFKNPENLTLIETYWTFEPVGIEILHVFNKTDYRGKGEPFPHEDLTLVLKLSNVTRQNAGKYCLTIVTNEEKYKSPGCSEIQLKVTELSVEIPEEVVERKSSVLLCKSSCNLADRANFTWYKNGEAFPESISTNELKLQSVSSDDAGNYSCAVRDQKHLPSPAVTLSVRYPPRSVSVSVSPSGEIVEGDSVTLSCSSDSNPPALNFSWFKENQSSAVGSGQSFSISSLNSSHSGRFYCEAHNPYGSQRSASVSVTVKEESSSWTMITVGVIVAVFLTSVILIIGLLIRRKRVTPSEQKNHRGSRHKTVESPEGTYMTLDPKSRSSEYDTLDNMKRSCGNTNDCEAQDPVYYNIGN